MWDVLDYGSTLIAPGLFFGRMGNFINGELWGRVTTVPWAVICHSSSDGLPSTHLSCMKCWGKVWFCLSSCVHARSPRKTKGSCTALFLIAYGIIRFAVEFFREPDAHIGFVGLGLSMGQLLCGFMVAVGATVYGFLRYTVVKKQAAIA